MSCWHFPPQTSRKLRAVLSSFASFQSNSYLSKGPLSQRSWHWGFLSCSELQDLPWRGSQGCGGGDTAQLVLRWSQPTGHLVSSPCYAHSLVWEVETFFGIQHFFFNLFCKPGCIKTVGNIGWYVILYCLFTYRNRCTETQRYRLAGAQWICTCWKSQPFKSMGMIGCDIVILIIRILSCDSRLFWLTPQH